MQPDKILSKLNSLTAVDSEINIQCIILDTFNTLLHADLVDVPNDNIIIISINN